MKRTICAVAVAVLVYPIAGGEKPKNTPETRPLEFVTEFIRELAAVERIRAAGEQEQSENKADSVFAAVIHTSTAFQLELGTRVRMLKQMRLRGDAGGVIKPLIETYEQKISLYERLIEIGSAFVGGPKPNVDYDKLAAETPKIRAGLEFVDHTIFEDITPLVFATLIDMRPDSKNHASHLVITKAEKATLLQDLEDRFGTKMDEKTQNLTVSAATVLRGYLLKDWKCSDEPWE
jgi:hypothetical protein